QRVIDAVVLAKLRDQGDLKETYCDQVYRRAMESVFSSIDWDFENETLLELEKSLSDHEDVMERMKG
ncbi:MAG: hypothetical protein ACXAEN_26275, partial [Candidatus Thorarchaeota archaeon]